MRYIMKGGVWKNSEDQILKAAIMKYGLNQWSRISSLLQRKSAKQCKQRWYEWLDPSIKKTQWTRTEDEKLLQLARVFPSQWRTIAPFVGRTPTQCYDRYQKLLDIAQGKNPNDPNDLRKLRPGQIDPNPQTKPARPDPIDMDQDEKQMLAEVRVRLANTKGKKAKRKQREKMIDEARRLAQLQKARQLKMAGVENILTQQELKRLKKRNDINYNKEVPFKRQVPEFVYKAQSSQTPTNSAFALNISLQTLQGKRRDVEQQLMRKMDKRRLRKFRQRDLTAAILQRRQIAMPPPVPISLPQPQLADKDLQELKKLNITTPLNTQLINQTPIGMTPQNKILFSARVNLSLNYNEMRQNANEQEVDGIQGLKYLKTLEKDAFKRNFQNSIKPISERMKTPINEWEKSDEGKLQRLFKGLRKPQNIIQFEIPEQEEQQEQEQIMDAQQYERLQNIKQQKILEQKLKNRSSTLKKQLPRFKVIPEKIYYYQRNEALMQIENQYISLVYSDANDYPLQGMQFPQKQIKYRQNIEEDLINEANLLIRIEQKKFQNPYEIDFLTSQQIRNKIKLDFQSKNIQVTQENNKLSNQKGIYKVNLPQYQIHNKKAETMEKKCSVILAGFQKKLKQKTKEINQMLQKLQTLRIQRQTLEQLRLHEQYSIRSRLQQLQTYYSLIYQSI